VCLVVIAHSDYANVDESRIGEKAGEFDVEDKEKVSKKQLQSDSDDCSLEKLGKLVSNNLLTDNFS